MLFNNDIFVLSFLFICYLIFNEFFNSVFIKIEKIDKNRISTIAITKIYKLRFELINYPFVFTKSDP